MVAISAIIPTYKRPQLAMRALRSFQAQLLEPFELIVVDNAADPSLQEQIEQFNARARIPGVYVPEPRLGLHHARHAGVRAASGDVLVFTDDDATFSPGWLTAYAEAFAAHPDMAAAGGPVRPVWEQAPPQWLLDYMGDAKIFGILSLMEPWDSFRLSTDGFFFGVNMAIRRHVFNWTGFHPELVGSRTIGDGESGLNAEISSRGDLIGYVPEAVVYHHIPASRMDVRYIRRWAWHLGGAYMYRRWRGRARSTPALFKEALSIARLHLKYWIAGYVVRPRRDPRSIDIQFNASLGWCKLTYLWWMLTDPTVKTALDKRDFRP